MPKIIDHDEDDRDSSEYEELDDDENEQEELVSKTINHPQIYDETHEPSTSGPSNQDYEEVYDRHPDSEIHVSHEEMIDSDKVYYENDMEHLVIDEIFGGNSHKTRLEDTSKRMRDVLVSSPSCIVCNRTESAKIRLFRWPRSEDLREQWIHFFRLPTNVLSITPEPYICSFHFSADTFVMVEERIFWKASALPKYRYRRPCLSDPFPWEAGAKQKIDHIPEQRSNDTPQQYRIRYRMPFNKHKSRNSHPVAVLSPVNQPHLYYEYHFNRDGSNGTKFFACLSCRKAKIESGIRDVIRTIHLKETKLLSQGDPFCGHHFACRPHSVYDYRSTWRPIPDQSGDPQYVDDVVYIDERGNSIEWENCIRQGDSNLENTNQITNGEIYNGSINMDIKNDGDILQDEIIGEQTEILETVYTNDKIPPMLEEIYVTSPSPLKKQKLTKSMKCHLCLQRSFTSTRHFVEHLQKHLDNEKKCQRCFKRISCDSPPILIRRQMCSRCWDTTGSIIQNS